MKKVSVVMCTYNGEQFLKEQLDSIINQTYPIYEIVVQDDCSTDNTPLIIEEYSKRIPSIIFYRNETQKGVNKNFYSAISKAAGEYIAISDQDDIWDIHKIEKQMACIEGNLLCFSFSKPFSHGGVAIAFDERIPNYFAERLVFLGSASGHTILMHADLVNKMTSLIDFDCYLYDSAFQIVAALEERIVFCPEVLVYQRRHINATTFTTPLVYNKSLKGMAESVRRTLKLYAEIRPKIRELYQERYLFLKAVPVEDCKKRKAIRFAYYMQTKGVFNYLKLTVLCVKHRNRIFYTTRGDSLLSFLRGIYFPISCSDYFRYFSSKKEVGK